MYLALSHEVICLVICFCRFAFLSRFVKAETCSNLWIMWDKDCNT